MQHVTIIFAITCFLAGFYMMLQPPEAFTNTSYKDCPNILIQKGPHYFLFNNKLAEIPGVNPIQFNNLEEYSEYIDWQRSTGRRCPILYVQEVYDTQGKPVYKARPDPEDMQAGAPDYFPQDDPNKSQLVDAGRDDPPYNHNGFPAFDPENQYIGLNTPLDSMKST